MKLLGGWATKGEVEVSEFENTVDHESSKTMTRSGNYTVDRPHERRAQQPPLQRRREPHHNLSHLPHKLPLRLRHGPDALYQGQVDRIRLRVQHVVRPRGLKVAAECELTFPSHLPFSSQRSQGKLFALLRGGELRYLGDIELIQYFVGGWRLSESSRSGTYGCDVSWADIS